MNGNIPSICGPVGNGPVRLTRQDYDAWAHSMGACMLAVQADILLREHARTDPPRFTVKRMNRLIDACVAAGWEGPRFEFPAGGYADLRDVLFADDLIERWAQKQGISVFRDDDNLFVATRRHATFGMTQSGLMVPRGFHTRVEAVLYALGKHPEAATAHYPGAIEHYMAKENFVAAESARRDAEGKVPIVAPEHIKVQIPTNATGKIDTRGVARLFEAMITLCGDAGVTEPEILKALQVGVDFGDDIAKDLGSIAEKMKAWPALDPRHIEILKKKIYPRLNAELRQQMTELFGSEENGFDPLGGNLPPGCDNEPEK